MSLRYAILGFLSYAPLSGYDLKKSFDKSLGHLWPADQSQIYRTLSQLLEDRLLEVETFPREDRLARKVYYITDEGLDELRHWLTTSLNLSVHRQQFLLQLHFGSRLSDDEILNLMEQERRKVQQRLDTVKNIYVLARQQHALFENPRQSFYNLLTIEHTINMAAAYRDWIQDVINRIELADYSLSVLND